MANTEEKGKPRGAHLTMTRWGSGKNGALLEASLSRQS
jgi:hypothetical protein